MRVLDLFSGIGGFSLAAHWMGWRTVAFCEKDKFCQKVLAKNFPGIPIHDDIFTLKGTEYGAIDLICGGYPCQPFSIAGEQQGQDDDRYLWPEMERVIAGAKPTWVLAENVVGIIDLALDQALSDLEARGYTAWTLTIPAIAVNADHERDRVWIIAHASSERQKGGLELSTQESWQVPTLSSGAHSFRLPPPRSAGDVRAGDGLPTGMDEYLRSRIGAVGNAIVPEIAYQIFQSFQQTEEMHACNSFA